MPYDCKALNILRT